MNKAFASVGERCNICKRDLSIRAFVKVCSKCCSGLTVAYTDKRRLVISAT